MDYLIASFNYVTADKFFWPSMALTVIIGMLIAATVYDGELKQVKKFWISLSAYILLILLTSCARLLPLLPKFDLDQRFMPFAATVTILLVTFFYLLGMSWGVFITHKAHKKRGVHKWI